MNVSLFVTCLTDNFYPDTGIAVVRVLRRLGCNVTFPKNQTCCGQPQFNNGFFKEARKLARKMIRDFEGAEVIVSPSGSCTAMVREHFPELFHDDPDLHAKAVAMAERTYDFAEFLQKVLKVDLAPLDLRWDGTCTYHYSCHLRGLGVTPEETPALLRQIPGLDFRPLERVEQCCGFGGTFAVKFEDVSAAMVFDKVECIRRTGARTCVVNDGGCTMNIAGAAKKAGLDVEFKHIAVVLDEAMRWRERSGASAGAAALPASAG